MSTKSSLEIGYRQGDETTHAQPSFHLLLPISDRDCAHCLAAAEDGMREITRLVAALEARAAGEALINAIGESVRSMVGTRTIKMIAAGSLGNYLRVDRCFFVTYDHAALTATVEFDWRKDGLASIVGTFEIDDVATTALGLDTPHTLAVSSDAAFALGPFQPTAFVHVPLLQLGRPIGALIVATDDREREWDPADICLIENVASIARSAIDIENLRSREHGLKTSFRSALLPTLPPSVKGIDISVVYRPADVDAGVGGDFYDVFDIGDGRTAIVVGDVSGRGLASASQVATLRNLIRFALYRPGSLSEAVTGINELIIRHRLIEDYAGVFVAVFDPTKHMLTYINCGQEPPLIRRRSNDEIAVLAPTAPVLGITTEVGFREETVRLGRGDCLLVYTDGLGDIGSTRLKQILGHGRPPFAASNVVDAVMSGIVDHGGRNGKYCVDFEGRNGADFDDDVCVLAAIFKV